MKKVWKVKRLLAWMTVVVMLASCLGGALTVGAADSGEALAASVAEAAGEGENQDAADFETEDVDQGAGDGEQSNDGEVIPEPSEPGDDEPSVPSVPSDSEPGVPGESDTPSEPRDNESGTQSEPGTPSFPDGGSTPDSSIPDDTDSQANSDVSSMESVVEQLESEGEIKVNAGVLADQASLFSALDAVWAYGVIASTMNSSSNQRTNIATATYRANGSYTATPDLAGGRELPFIVRTAENQLTIADGLPADVALHLKSNDDAKLVVENALNRTDVKKIYQSSTEIEALYRALMQKGIDASRQLASAGGTTELIVTTEDQTNYVLDTTGGAFAPDAVIVINADDLLSTVSDRHLTIRKTADQVIAFNTTRPDVSVGSYLVEVDGGRYAADASINESQNALLRQFFTSNVIWNFQNAKTVDLSGTAGTFLAPVKEVQVNLTGASTGTVVANGVLNAGASWHFVQTSRPQQVTLAVKKTADKSVTIPAEAFTFDISALDDGAPLPSAVTTVNGLDGFATFDTIDLAGYANGGSRSFRYRIRETAVVDASSAAWAINTTPVYAKITISESGEAAVNYYTDEACTQGEAKSASIQNTYKQTITPVKVALKAKKELKVKDGFEVALNNQPNFILDLTPKTNGREGDSDTQITGQLALASETSSYTTYSGTVTFKTLTFDAAGTYTYEISEQNGGKAGYIYDGSVYTVTITVKQSGTKYTASVAYKKKSSGSSKETKSVRFTNYYAPSAIFEAMKVNKVVEGDSGKDDVFNFVLSRVKSGRTMETISTTGSGSAAFSKLKYGKPGTYTYKIVEQQGSECYVYDKSEYIVRIAVSDNNGTLEKDVTYMKNNLSYSEAVFTNKFLLGSFTFYKVRADATNQGVRDAVYAIYKISAAKGSEDYNSTVKLLQGGVVEFDKLESKLTKVEEQTSAANGKVTFEELWPDDYYVIRETEVPAGYQRSKYPIVIHTVYANDAVNVTIVNSGYNTAGKDEKSGIYKWYEQRINVVVNKRSSSGGLLAGAVLTLYDESTGKAIERWQSANTEGHTIVVKLVAGRQYRIVENRAPAGYEKASDTTFTVEAREVGSQAYVQNVNIINYAKGSRGSGGGSGGGAGGTDSGSTTKTGGSKTGDTSNALLWIIILIAAAAAGVTAVLLKRKKR